MKWEDVIEIPPWGEVSIWDEVNGSIKNLIRIHKHSLGMVYSVAYEIKEDLLSLFPLQDEILKETCINCDSPCCGTATVWLDFCDLVFIHLTEQVVPEYQLIEKQSDICRYFSDNGCIIPRLSRPWVCTLYLCPPQMALLRGMGGAVKRKNDMIIQSIKLKRKKLEQLFINRTS